MGMGLYISARRNGDSHHEGLDYIYHDSCRCHSAEFYDMNFEHLSALQWRCPLEEKRL